MPTYCLPFGRICLSESDQTCFPPNKNFPFKSKYSNIIHKEKEYFSQNKSFFILISIV